MSYILRLKDASDETLEILNANITKPKLFLDKESLK